jgi:cytochrome c peroxidase
MLDLARDTKLELAFDVAALLNAPRPLSFGKDGSSTHSREGDPIAAALVKNLPGAFRVRRVSALSPMQTAGNAPAPLYLPQKFTPYLFQMSATFPIPDLPRDNPLTKERVTLGEKLFHETAISRDGTRSCASCHPESAAFSDSRRFSLGVRDQKGKRNATPLFNLAWKSSFFWDGRAPSLRAQALVPIQDHAEMDESLTNVVAKLTGTAGSNGIDYAMLFETAFGSPEITPEKIGLALEQFMLTLTSSDSRFDRAMKGGAQLNEQEKRGFELFMTENNPRQGQYGADCFHCHGGPLFQSQTFANNGLDATLSDSGRAIVTGKDSDQGKFATPSLRNVALTAPYMHDGRFQTLEEVVEHYSTGVKRSSTLDPNLAKHPDGGLHLSSEGKSALVAFLKTLTDERFNPRATTIAKRP